MGCNVEFSGHLSIRNEIPWGIPQVSFVGLLFSYFTLTTLTMLLVYQICSCYPCIHDTKISGLSFRYSCFKKGRKKCTRQSWKVLWVILSSLFFKKFQRIAREAMHLCLRVLKESNISRFDSYGVRKSALIISHITFRDCRVHSFSDNLSRNSCILNLEMGKLSIWFKAHKLSPKSKTDQIYGLQTKLKAYELWYSNKYW